MKDLIQLVVGTLIAAGFLTSPAPARVFVRALGRATTPESDRRVRRTRRG